MARLESRITALEVGRAQALSIYECTTAELEAMLAPEFGGRVPTTVELQEFLEKPSQNTGRSHGID